MSKRILARLEVIAGEIDKCVLARNRLQQERNKLWRQGTESGVTTTDLARASRVSPMMIRQARRDT